MNVDLIDFTGKGQKDPADYAGRLLVYIKNTRLEQGADTRAKIAAMSGREVSAELEAIANTIRSSWEFIEYNFEIKGVTRAFTHQFVRTRVGISFAQQAQRVVNMGGFDCLLPETVKNVDGGEVWAKLMDQISETYQFYQEEGVPNQDCRGVLPTNVKTNIIAKMNLRTLADLVGKRENLRAQGEYSDVIRACADLALDVHPWIKGFLRPERTQTPALDAILARIMGSGSPVDNPELNDALKELDRLKGTWG